MTDTKVTAALYETYHQLLINFNLLFIGGQYQKYLMTKIEIPKLIIPIIVQ